MPKQAALTELQNNFIKQKFGESFVGQDPATVLSLYKNQNKEVEFLSDIVSFPFPNIVQYVTSSYVFINGTAHGVSGINIGIYSITDGKKIELGSLFLKDWEKNIVKLIIKEFLLSQNLQVLGDYNYTQKESDFMPERARISESGLEFVFPPYQVAPYAAGEQSVFLSWNILKPYLNKKSLIYQKLKF
ncbi:MAG: RsiV family protein [Fibromonadaceae bacterium]|nr:RsiV family protein [Fibromonadaceae bacterium]